MHSEVVTCEEHPLAAKRSLSQISEVTNVICSRFPAIRRSFCSSFLLQDGEEDGERHSFQREIQSAASHSGFDDITRQCRPCIIMVMMKYCRNSFPCCPPLQKRGWQGTRTPSTRSFTLICFGNFPIWAELESHLSSPPLPSLSGYGLMSPHPTAPPLSRRRSRRQSSGVTGKSSKNFLVEFVSCGRACRTAYLYPLQIILQVWLACTDSAHSLVPHPRRLQRLESCSFVPLPLPPPPPSSPLLRLLSSLKEDNARVIIYSEDFRIHVARQKKMSSALRG